MLKLLSCPRHHFWEAEAPGDGPADGAVCPECGAPAESLPLIDLAPSAAPPGPPPPPSAPVVLLFDADGRPFVTGYEVQEALGKTPAGVALYRARQALTKRAVLLKVVAAKEDTGQRGWNSLRGEASALGKLQSPHVVAILEAGERERQLFYNVLEYVDGPTLAQMAAERPLPFAQDRK